MFYTAFTLSACLETKVLLYFYIFIRQYIFIFHSHLFLEKESMFSVKISFSSKSQTNGENSRWKLRG